MRPQNVSLHDKGWSVVAGGIWINDSTEVPQSLVGFLVGIMLGVGIVSVMLVSTTEGMLVFGADLSAVLRELGDTFGSASLALSISRIQKLRLISF